MRREENKVDTVILEIIDISALAGKDQEKSFIATKLLLAINACNEKYQVSQKDRFVLERQIENLIDKEEQRKILYETLNLLLFKQKTKNKFQYFLFKMYWFFRERKRLFLRKENIGLKNYYDDELFNKRLTESIYILLRINRKIK